MQMLLSLSLALFAGLMLSRVAKMVKLPAVTASDNGKFLRVVNGAWAAETIPTYQGGSY